MNEETLFAEALKRRDAVQRAAFLEQACGANAPLRRRIEELIRAHDVAGGLLDKPVATLEGTSDAPPGQWLDPDNLPQTPLEGVGSRIKQYKLLQQIGEGGMGVVFMAEQQEPVRRMVALKVIKAGMDSAQVIARFEQERQALALMDHPNIAKVLDAGTTASGRPFFVMELVKGIPITRYCDEQRLSPKQRLELFVPVCQAIQHAHQKGIIHRDIKPSNVLIAAYDGKPVPKVIDFGVAKATGGKLTERTLFTGFGGLVGTLEYMSPEQAEFNALDIDTRSDVYSLGVLLYELLTGSTPLTRQRIKDAAIMEVLRLIREEEPPRPSTRLSESKDSLASVSAQRQSEPAALVKAIRGEVDWIVMKALDKDRTRRYDTANGLARDIQRYLAEEPVEAAPPSAAYRLRKLAWKHRSGLATAAALLLLLLAGVAVSTILAVWALREERLANQRLKRAEEAEEEVRGQLAEVQRQKERAVKAEGQAKSNESKARQEEAKAKEAQADSDAVLKFFKDRVLSAGRPKEQGGGLGYKVTLREAVDEAEPTIEQSFQGRPRVEASIRDTLGQTYLYLGDAIRAIDQYERTVELYRALFGADHPNTLFSRMNLAAAYSGDAGRFKEAIRLYEPTLRQLEAKLGSDHYGTLLCRKKLAGAYREVRRLDEAIALLKPTLGRMEATLGADHPDTLQCRDSLATLYFDLGRIAEAIDLYEKTLKQLEAKLGTNDPVTLEVRCNLGEGYMTAGRIPEATRLLEQTLQQQQAKLGPNHPETYHTRRSLENARQAQQLRDRYEQARKTKGEHHIDTLLALRNVAENYGHLYNFAEAERLLLKVSAGLRSRPKDDVMVLWNEDRLTETYILWGRIEKARPLLKDRLKRSEASRNHPDMEISSSRLMQVLIGRKQYVDAETLLRDLLKDYDAAHPDDVSNCLVRSWLGEALVGQEKYAEAEALLLQAYQALKQRQDKLPPNLRRHHLSETVWRLVQLYGQWGKKDEAAKWRKELSTSKTADKK